MGAFTLAEAYYELFPSERTTSQTGCRKPKPRRERRVGVLRPWSVEPELEEVAGVPESVPVVEPEPEPVEIQSEFPVHVLKLSSNSAPRTDLLSLGRYDWVHSLINTRKFIGKGRLVGKTLAVYLVSYPKVVTGMEVEEDLLARGMRPLGVKELLCFGGLHLPEYRDRMIVALETKRTSPKHAEELFVPVIKHGIIGRELGLFEFARRWRKGTIFVAALI